MSKAQRASGLCCGKCSHKPPRPVSMTPFTHSTTARSLASPQRHVLPGGAKPLGIQPKMPYNCPDTSQCATVVAFFRVTPGALVSRHSSQMPACYQSLDLCSMGAERASHFPKDTQLLSKDLSPDLSTLSQVPLAQKS